MTIKVIEFIIKKHPPLKKKLSPNRITEKVYHLKKLIPNFIQSLLENGKGETLLNLFYNSTVTLAETRKRKLQKNFFIN